MEYSFGMDRMGTCQKCIQMSLGTVHLPNYGSHTVNVIAQKYRL